MTAPLTGLTFPAQTDRSSLVPVLERIANTSLNHLRQGGYISAEEAEPLLPAYKNALTSLEPPMDFLIFVAEQQAKRHSLTAEGEVARMQKLLRTCLNDRVNYWSFGPLPGRAGGLYEHCPGLRGICATLGCPATLAGETSIVHIASINPVAAKVTAFWIRQELNRETDTEAPFVFPFLLDLPAWQVLMQRHFAP